MSTDIFIVGAARTPIGSFMGALADISAPELGAVAIKAALERAGIDPGTVDETYMGNVLTAGVGQAPARQAAKAAGMPNKTPATTINKVCGSGLQAVILGMKSIALGDANIVVAGGMESMSTAPYLLPKARAGYRMGHGRLIDSMVHDGLWDPYNDSHMGQAGELCAREFGYSREQQDAFAKESYQRALKAQQAGVFVEEIAPVAVKTARIESVVAQDEEPGRANLEKMPKLQPVFDPKGTITAANASSINDGGAALVLANAAQVSAKGLKPLARIVAYAGHAQAPEWFTTAPVGAINNVLQRGKLTIQDIDLVEINEAFAVVPMACVQKVNIDHAKVNIHGGAVALGHPIGASGARILITLLYALQAQNAKRGLASICIGGGEALAVVIERV
jgi:acetyl-CoA C-acetyltransferase